MNNQYNNQNTDNLSYVMKGNIYQDLTPKPDINQGQMEEEGFISSQGIYGNSQNNNNNTGNNQPEEGYHFGNINYTNDQNNKHLHLSQKQLINININIHPKDSVTDQNIYRNKSGNIRARLNEISYQPNNNGYIAYQSQQINTNQLGQQYPFLNDQYRINNIPNNVGQQLRGGNNNNNKLNRAKTFNQPDKPNVDISKQYKKKLTISNIKEIGSTIIVGNNEELGNKIIQNENNRSLNNFGDNNSSLNVNSGSFVPGSYEAVQNNTNNNSNSIRQDLIKAGFLSTIDPNNSSLKQINNLRQYKSEYHYKENQGNINSALRNNINQSANNYNQFKGVDNHSLIYNNYVTNENNF